MCCEAAASLMKKKNGAVMKLLVELSINSSAFRWNIYNRIMQGIAKSIINSDKRIKTLAMFANM